METIEVNDFLLKETLESGQFFNYIIKQNNWYYIVNGQESFLVKQDNSTLYFDGCSENYLREFFGLDFNLDELDLIDDNLFEEAFTKYRGLRIMKCDLFQTIITFICSANANQKKIEKNIKLLCEKFGEKGYYFPSPEQIDDYDKLLECSVGYRAKYILKTSNFIAKNVDILEDLKYYDYENARTLLMTFPGIGSKVADCICLFALNHFEAFPVDVWIKKFLESQYLLEGSSKFLEEKAKEMFGNYGGYYQQYIFHYVRNNSL